MWKRITRWWAAEGALVGLSGQSDRMLADMGLERAGLRSRVLGKEVEAAGDGLPPPALLMTPCRC